jgi:CBS domain-containing protein
MDIELKLTTEQVDQAWPTPPVCVPPQSSIRDAFRAMRENRSGCVLVCRDGILEGIFTERDALRLMARRANLDEPVATVMVVSPVTVRSDATVGSAILRMSSGGYRRVPIVDAQGRPTGIVQVSGIIHYLVEHFPKTIYNQPPVAHPVMQERDGA